MTIPATSGTCGPPTITGNPIGIGMEVVEGKYLSAEPNGIPMQLHVIKLKAAALKKVLSDFTVKLPKN